MKPIKIAMLSSISVHAPIYIQTLPQHKMYDWVALSVAPKDRNNYYFNDIPSNVKIYESDEDLLKAHKDLDAVILAGSNNQTYNEFVMCAKYGIKNILTMKVPTFFKEEYDEMQRLVKENDMIVQIELEMRYEQTVRRIKDLCDSGAIGKILSLQINNTTVCLPPSLLPWVTNPKESYGRKVLLKEGDNRYRGGALTDHPHGFDMARFITNSDFESVYADISPVIRPNIPVEEGVFVLAKMKNGVVVNIDPSYSRHENKILPVHPVGPGWEGYPKRVEVDVVINGEKGSIFADCFHSGVYYTGLPRNTYAYVYPRNNAHFFPSLDDFANSIHNHLQPLINLDIHRKNMEAVNACYESISTGKVIHL